jgi:K(+)-stimulated pyrophosphate-energized sodium pump
MKNDFISVVQSLPWPYWFSMISGIGLLLFAFIRSRQIHSASSGTENMVFQAATIKKAAKVYLLKQARLILIVFVLLTGLVVWLILDEKQSWPTAIGIWTGGGFSFLASYVAMLIATDANVRMTHACRSSLRGGHALGMRAGSIFGSMTVGLVIFDIGIWYFILQFIDLPFVHSQYEGIMKVMLSFGVGASTQAYFARVGGGIFTKAADMAADLAGKNKFNLPEDHVTNAAVTADNVGDNVGDVAGMGPDLFESKVATLLSSMLLGVLAFQNASIEFDVEMILLFPLFISAVGGIFSNLGIEASRIPEGAEENTSSVNKAMVRGALVAVIPMIIFVLFLPQIFGFPTYFRTAIIAGLIAALLIGLIVNYFTSYDYAPVKNMAKSFKQSAATGIIKGMGYGYLSVAPTFLIVILVMVLDISISPKGQTLTETFINATYTMSLSALGVMMMIGYILAIDFYGPVSDNAGGIAETVNLPSKVRKRTDTLDAVGNTTAAICKGFAFGSAAMAAVALMSSYPQEIGLKLDSIRVFDLNFILGIMSAAIVVGIVIFLLANGVANAADKLISEVERQIEDISKYLKKTGSKISLADLDFDQVPRVSKNGIGLDENKAVAMATRAAQRQTLLPTLVVIFFTIFVRYQFGVEGALGYIFAMVPMALLVAINMSNSGGAYDNAKKFIEKMAGGKGSETHKNSVVGDTVGDPLKDTIGPAFNILMKWPILLLILLG